MIVAADISLNGEAGVQVGGVVEKSYSSSAKPAVLHSCPLCVDGEIDFLLSLGMNFNLDIFLQDAFDKHISLANEKIPFRDFYISFGGGEDPVEFGWGECPHMQYLVTIWAEDQNGTAVGNAQIEISGSGQEDIAGTTTGNGVFQTYCADGRYTISATAEGYEDGQASLRVNGKPAEVTVEMERQEQEKVYITHSFAESGVPSYGTAKVTVYSDTEALVEFSDLQAYESEIWENRNYDFWIDFSAETGERSWWTAISQVNIAKADTTSNPQVFIFDQRENGNVIHDWYYPLSAVDSLQVDYENYYVSWRIVLPETSPFKFSMLENEGVYISAQLVPLYPRWPV